VAAEAVPRTIGKQTGVILVEPRIPTRLGDGSLTEMTRSEIKSDLEEGTQAAAARGKVPPLTEDELDHLLDIFASTSATRS